MSDYRDSAHRTPWRLIVGLPILLLVVVGIFLLARPSGQRNGAKNGLGVVAAENFWGNIASQLGGSHVHVTSIITDPNADPHLYESSAQDASAVSSADVVVVNGVGYDDFMGKLLGVSQNSHRQVITAAQILGASETDNHHLWYDIPRVDQIASKITASYIAKDPSHTNDYRHNLAAFNQSLQPLLGAINNIKQRYAGTPVAYTEPVPGYLLSATGLGVKTPEGFAKSIEDGNDPSPADVSAMDGLITGKAIKVLLYNSQTTSPVTEHVKGLAKQAGIPVVGVSETLPPDEHTYQTWQQNQLDQLRAALETRQ